MTTAPSPQTPAELPPKILVVDDDQIILRTLSLKLKSSGYRVSTAADGSEAVSAVRKEKPDLILLDISFPPDVAHGGGVSWDGFRIIDWLRRIDEAHETPIIIISASDPAQFEQRALKAGAVAFFQKPINHEALVKVIEKSLGRAPTPGPEHTADPGKSSLN